MQSKKVCSFAKGIPIIEENIWNKIKFLLPQKPENKKIGRPRHDDKLIMSGIFYLLRTGCQWKMAPRTYGSPSTIHRRFQEWVKYGVFQLIFERILQEYDLKIGLDLDVQSIDGSLTKAPLGGEATGPNPTDRRKLGTKRSILADADGIPIGLAVGPANMHDVNLFEKTICSKPKNLRFEDDQKICTDKGYDSEKVRSVIVTYFYLPYGRSKNPCEDVSNEQYRWVVERTFSWINRFRRILIRWEKKLQNYVAMLQMAFVVIILQKLIILG